MFLLKRWTAFMSYTVDTGSLDERNVYTVDTGWKESIRICQHCRYRFIWYSKCFYSKDELPSCRHCRYTSRMDSKQIYEFHPVFEMYYWRQRACRHCRYKVVWVENLQYWMKGIHPNMSNTVDTGSSGIRNVSTQKMNCLHVDTVDTNREWIWKQRYRFIWYSKCFYSKDELPSCRICQHCRYKVVWVENLQYNTVDTGSSGIRNVSTQKMNCLHVNTVDTGWKESIWICQHCRYRFIWYSKCFYSKDELPSCRHCRYKSRMDLKQRYRFIWYSKCFYSKDELSSCLHCRYWMKGIHPNMSTLSIQVHLVFEMFLLKRWTAFMSTLSIHIENGFKANIRVSSSIRNVLLKTESMSTLSIQGCLSRKSSILDERNPSEYVDTVDTRLFE